MLYLNYLFLINNNVKPDYHYLIINVDADSMILVLVNIHEIKISF